MRSIVRALPRLMSFVAGLLVATHAWSQDGGDSGQWQILQARYGTVLHDLDVTQRVRELVRDDTTFRVTNGLSDRDPHPGVVKSLRIYARGPGGATRTFEYAENQSVQGTLFTAGSTGDSGQWQILQARYGTILRNIDVTRQVSDLARRNEGFRVGNDLFGKDPHPGVAKTLRIYARGPGGAIRTFEYAENQSVGGDLFGGWSDTDQGQPGAGGRDANRGQDSIGW